MIIKKARVEDFEQIYNLLLDFNNSSIKKEDWRQLFINHWNNSEDYFGYVLIDNNKAVGFQGLIFSRRIINGQTQKICNLTSWIVKREYRNNSVALLLPVLKLKGYTITNFTASKEVCLMLKRLGFKELETRIKIIPPVSVIGFLSGKCSVEFDRNEIKRHLSKKDLNIYSDHSKLKAIYLLIKEGDEYSYLVLNRTKKRFFHFAQIHYISNLRIFLKYINRISMRICLRLNVFGLLVDERYVEGHKIRNLITIKLSQPNLFKAEFLTRDDINTLYSELLVLNI